MTLPGLVPQTMKAKFEVSHKNFLAVGHKRPETGLLVALNSIVPQRSRVLEARGR